MLLLPLKLVDHGKNLKTHVQDCVNCNFTASLINVSCASLQKITDAPEAESPSNEQVRRTKWSRLMLCQWGFLKSIN